MKAREIFRRPVSVRGSLPRFFVVRWLKWARGVTLALGAALAGVAIAGEPAAELRVAVVQTRRGPTASEESGRIVAWISQAADRGARVVVFPEGALGGASLADGASLDAAIDALRQAAREHKLYVLCGIAGYDAALKGRANWMIVVGPDGRDVFRYHKLYDQHDAPMPGVFLIDGVPCSTMICADRWLRGIEEVPIQQGAQISFELSGNFPTEWVPPFQWYWYVPRALRNNVWVVFANTAGRPGQSELPVAGHGHSAIVAPDGLIVASRPDAQDGMIVADIDVAKATRAGAIARSAHPALKAFWTAGVTLQQGGRVEAPPLNPLPSPKIDITLAAASIAGDMGALKSAIRAARAKNADLVAFPARAVAGEAIEEVRAAARENHITVVVGATQRAAGGTFNSAFVIGPDGSMLTRYDQLSALPPFQAGTDPAKMWFAVKGVPAIVTLGRDALWTELAELAAVAGARIVIHLEHDADVSDQARQTRLQVWSNHASFLTFTATVNVGDAALWDDLRGMEEISAEAKRRQRPDTGAVEVYSPWSANLVARASSPSELIVATRTIPAATNPHHPLQTTRYNPQMDAWYRIGARVVRPD